MVAQKEEERDTAYKVFEVLLIHFGSGMKRHQPMMSFEKRRQKDDESIDRFTDDPKSLRRKSNPASNFIEGVKKEVMKTMLASYHTLSKDNSPTTEELRHKSRENIRMKLKKYSLSDN